MIPKTIHYCWFGLGKKPRRVKKCLRSWQKILPDYQIIEWNEKTCDLSSAPVFVQQAIDAKMWAFATDYLRYHVVYQHGGFYFDTDVEILKDLDFLRTNKAFFGIQYNAQVASGLGFGAEKGTPILLELMNNYRNIPFILSDGQYNKTPCPERDTPVFVNHGYLQDGSEQVLEGDVHIYPAEYFCPCGRYDRKPNITGNTVAIHWFTASWLTRRRRCLIRLRKALGPQLYQRMRDIIKGNR